MSIRKKLIIYFMVTVLTISVVSAVFFSMSSSIMFEMKTLFRENTTFNEIMVEVENVESLVPLFLSSNNDVIVEDIAAHIDKLEKLSVSLPNYFSNEPNNLQKKNIASMLVRYIEDVRELVERREGNERYYNLDDYKDVQQTARLIETGISTLFIDSSINNSTAYVETIEKLETWMISGILLLETVVFALLLLSSRFARNISGPIVQLQEYSRKVAKGDYYIKMVHIETRDEIRGLAVSIEEMVESLKANIIEIKKNAKTAQRLQEQEFMNREMKHLLVITNQKALQAQVNPHFFYNTLNIASQLAVLEDADQTGEYLIKIAELFRYNLYSTQRLVILREEVQHVCNYIAIQEMRFQDEIVFEKDIDANVLSTPIPRMIIQPIIENCYIHAFDNIDRMGLIKLSCRKAGEYVCVQITDNGIGMDQDKISQLLDDTKRDEWDTQMSKSIGVQNIIQRLRYTYRDKNVINIISDGTGTTVRILLPPDIAKEGKNKCIKF